MTIFDLIIEYCQKLLDIEPFYLSEQKTVPRKLFQLKCLVKNE
jgi:hypothetical protein